MSNDSLATRDRYLGCKTISSSGDQDGNPESEDPDCHERDQPGIYISFPESTTTSLISSLRYPIGTLISTLRSLWSLGDRTTAEPANLVHLVVMWARETTRATRI